MMVLEKIHLRLFIAGDEPNSRQARENVTHLCHDYLENKCDLETIDILKDYKIAIESKIYVTPALKVDTPPKPTVTIYGNLNDEKKVLTAIGIKSG